MIPRKRDAGMNNSGLDSTLENSIDSEVWQDLLEVTSADQQFLSHHWYDVWSRTYAANDGDFTPVTFTSANGDQSHSKDSIFPCVVRSRGGIQVLSMAGYYYPFRTFLCHPDVRDTATERFMEAVHDDSSAAIVLLGPLQTDDDVSAPLVSSFQRKNWKICEVSAGAQQLVKLPGTVEEFRASLSRSLRKNHDRRKRSLESIGQFDISYYNSCSSELWDQAIDQCAQVESRCWLADDGKTRVYGQEEFWKGYAAREDGSRRLSVWVVSLDSKPIAYSLAVDSGASRYSISGQYDEAYKKHGVGIIAVMRMFEQGIETGKTVVNMGDGESEYKRRWGAQHGTELQSFYTFRPNIIVRLAHRGSLTVNWLRQNSVIHRLTRLF